MGLVSGTAPRPPGRAADRNSSSRTWSTPQPRQKLTQSAGTAAVITVLASPFVMDSVTTSRKAMAVAR